MSEKTISLNEFKEKCSGIILKEVCDKCGSENILICKDGEPPEIYPLAKCIDCGNKMCHDHYCWICGEAGEDGLVCLKCSDKYTTEEINELIKKMGKKDNINWNDEKYHYCEKCGLRFELVHFKDKGKVRTLCGDCFDELLKKELGTSNWTYKEVEKIYSLVGTSIEEGKAFCNSHNEFIKNN